MEGRFIAETELGGDWENCWTDTPEDSPAVPSSYATLAEAIAAIKEHIHDCKEAVKGGDMLDFPNPSEFRIVRDGVRYEYTKRMNWVERK